jgi:hypothetical protein
MGTKTQAGKEKVSQNAYKGGIWKQLREQSQALREQQRLWEEIFYPCQPLEFSHSLDPQGTLGT